MTVLFKSVQFIVYQSANLPLFVSSQYSLIIWLPNYMRNRTLVSK